MSRDSCRMQFTLMAQDGAARRGVLRFPRGEVQTPAFMTVGTYGTVKAMLPRDLQAVGAEVGEELAELPDRHAFLRRVATSGQGAARSAGWASSEGHASTSGISSTRPASWISR